MSSRPLVSGRSQVLVGDTTTHGGKVISGSSTFMVGGVPVARVGDMVTCPLCKPGLFPIVEGQANMLADGRPVALAGHSTACGAKLIAGAPSANAPAPNTPNSESGAKPQIKSGLGESVDALVAKSPSLGKALAEVKSKQYRIVYGPDGQGSSTDRPSRVITIDGQLKGKTTEALQALSHEVGHATHSLSNDVSSKSAYMNDVLDDEGAATLMNIKAQREIKTNKGPDIGIAGNPANHADYNKAYDTYQKTGNEAEAIRDVGRRIGTGEKTSTTGQNYNDYYGSWYDKNYSK